MNVYGFPDTVRLALFNRTISTTKTQLTEASTELVRGKKENITRQLAGRVGEYNLVSKAMADIDAAKTRLSLAENRLSHVDSALNAIRTTVDGFAEEAIQNLSLAGSVGVEQTKESARSFLDAMFSNLNTTHSGRSMFAGDAVSATTLASVDDMLTQIDTAIGGATDEATIDAAISAYFAPGGDFDNLIYQGGSGEAASVKLKTGAEVKYSIKADDVPFRQLMEGLVRVSIVPADSNETWAISAASMISQGEQGIIGMQADVGRQQNMISTALSLGEEEKLILTNTEQNLIGVDAYEAAARVQRLESQLQAAYTVTARLANLTFTDYL